MIDKCLEQCEIIILDKSKSFIRIVDLLIMTITNVFDAIRDGTYEDFKNHYDGKINTTSDNLGLNLLQFAVVNNYNMQDKKKIIEFLLKEGVDINFLSQKNKRNALHIFYFNVMRPDPQYLQDITSILVENGINLNATDRYGAIPLKYAITIVKLETQAIAETYKYLIKHGSNYMLKDNFGKSCADYANEYSWRNDVLELMGEAYKINNDEYVGFIELHWIKNFFADNYGHQMFENGEHLIDMLHLKFES